MNEQLIKLNIRLNKCFDLAKQLTVTGIQITYYNSHVRVIIYNDQRVTQSI